MKILSQEEFDIAKEEIKTFDKIDYPGTNDYVFKRLWHNSKRLAILVERITGIKIDSAKVEYLETEDKTNIEAKCDEYDIYVKSENIAIDLEMQNKDYKMNNENNYIISKYIDNRSVDYLCRIHSKQYVEGESYKKDKKSIAIWISNFKVSGNNAIDVWEITSRNTKKNFPNFQIWFVSLPMIKNDDKIKLEDKSFFEILSETDLSKYNNSEGVIKEMAKVISEVNRREAERHHADRMIQQKISYDTEMEISWLNGKDEGIKQGIEQGIEQGVLNVAKELLKLGQSKELISAATGLSCEEIENIKL